MALVARVALGEVGLRGTGGGPMADARREAEGNMLEVDELGAEGTLSRGEIGIELRSGAIFESERAKGSGDWFKPC